MFDSIRRMPMIVFCLNNALVDPRVIPLIEAPDLSRPGPGTTREGVIEPGDGA